MNLKSVLCAATMLAAAGVAQAFPSYSLSPKDGSVKQDPSEIANVNLDFGGWFSFDYTMNIVNPAAPSLYNTETGDEVICLGMELKMESVLVINFDAEEITEYGSGVWELTIPEGTFTLSTTPDSEAGEVLVDAPNPEIKATYTLELTSKEPVEYPQIEFVSIEPVEGSKILKWGGDGLTRVNVKTSDDAAVNYIGWELWNITTGAYVQQGSENRRDVNRNGHNDDIWTEGLYFTIGGEGQYLLENNEYELRMIFAGIGYDPATNQYPSPKDITESTELVKNVTYVGLKEPQEYAEAKYVSVSPDPETYEIDNPDLASFTIEYSAPVMPTEFNYSLGMGYFNQAGTWAPFEGMEAEDGLCTKWTFTFYKEVVANNTGSLITNVVSMDKDGLYVKGNADIDFDDIYYQMIWTCNCGAPELISVSPAAGSTLESLSSITVSNEKDGRTLPMNLSYVTAEKPRIVTRSGEEILVLDEPEFDEEHMSATWTFAPITENGNYILIIPKQYFALGEEFDGAISNLTTFEYIVNDGGSTSIVYDLLPSLITPLSNTEVSEISNVYLEFDSFTVLTFSGDEWMQKEINLYRLNEGEKELVESACAQDDMSHEGYDYMNPLYYVINFTPITEEGQYVIEVAEGTFCDEDCDMSFYESGRMNPAFNIYYTIGVGTGVDAIVAGESVINVFDINGVQVLKNANVDAAKELGTGLYIINGKKVMIRR